jgi:succinate-semialdehyde dehydrogenase/glutarate-semialdehyde dehydrogenase
MKAVILAGGIGVRLRPLTDFVAKSLLPINGRPVIEQVIEILRDSGINKICIVIGHLGEQVKDALSKGAKALLEGGRLKRKGFFYSPVVLADLTKDMKVLKEETFGPVAPIIPVKDEGEAIKTANETEFGLGVSIWSRSRERALCLAGEIEAGIAVINSLVKSDPRLPFGGVKKSGIGRELSKFGLYEFMNIKSISVY